MKQPTWFYRYVGWNGVTYYWPCHWVGGLLMVAAVGLALLLADLIVWAFRSADHPMLGWLSIIAIGAVYAWFDRIADSHAR